jgi:hypothetical protein
VLRDSFNLKEIMRNTMHTSNLMETTSSDYILVVMVLALDEAKLVNSISEAKEMIRTIKASNPHSDRLIHLKREIRQFEKELTHVRSLMYRKKLSSIS